MRLGGCHLPTRSFLLWDEKRAHRTESSSGVTHLRQSSANVKCSSLVKWLKLRKLNIYCLKSMFLISVFLVWVPRHPPSTCYRCQSGKPAVQSRNTSVFCFPDTLFFFVDFSFVLSLLLGCWKTPWCYYGGGIALSSLARAAAFRRCCHPIWDMEAPPWVSVDTKETPSKMQKSNG